MPLREESDDTEVLKRACLGGKGSFFVFFLIFGITVKEAKGTPQNFERALNAFQKGLALCT